MKVIVSLFNKYREIIMYLFIGGCTTLINIISYYVLYEILHIKNTASTIIALILSIVFAFVGNKLWVFGSHKNGLRQILRESISFFGCRILSGVLDVLIMYIAVDVLMRNALIWKCISNIIVIVLNYVASKFLIFKKQ